jgi:hypothetical protein
MKRIGTIALVATLTAALLAGTALAAGPGPGHGPGWGMHGPGYGMMQRGGPGMGMRGEFDEAKLAEIGAKLNLTTEQKPLWDAYVATVKEVSQGQKALADGLDRDAVRKQSYEEHMAFRDKMRTAMHERATTVFKARDALIAKLDDTQKATLRGTFGNGPCWQ